MKNDLSWEGHAKFLQSTDMLSCRESGRHHLIKFTMDMYMYDKQTNNIMKYPY